jgi:integrase
LFEDKVRNGDIVNGKMKLPEYFELWIEQYAMPKLAKKTVHEYKKLYPRIEDALGHLRLDQIRPMHLQKFYTNLQETGINAKTGGRLSANTVLHYHRLLSSMFTYAVRMEMMRDNPARKTEPPKLEREEARCLSEAETDKMLDNLVYEPLEFQVMINVLLHVGLRKSELAGLQWKDFDFVKRILKVQRQWQYISGEGKPSEAPPKRGSRRPVRISQGIVDLLLIYKSEQEQCAAGVGDYWQGGDWVFTQHNGEPRHPDTAATWFKVYLDKIGLDSSEIHLHTLRHSSASFLISKGVPIPTVSKRLGHASTAVTTAVYSHAIHEYDEFACDALDSLLSPRRLAPVILAETTENPTPETQ